MPRWFNAAGPCDPADHYRRRHGEALQGTAPYHEGSLEREYAIGRGRMDLCLRHGPDVLGIELKVWRDKRKDPRIEGLAQLDGYLEGLGLSTGWLVIFDGRSGAAPIEDRTGAKRMMTVGGREVVVIRA